MPVEQAVAAAGAEADVRAAMEERAAIEAELSGLEAELKTHGNVGMNAPLVDAEGFPRSDIDVYRVRVIRNRIISTAAAAGCVSPLVALVLTVPRRPLAPCRGHCSAAQRSQGGHEAHRRRARASPQRVRGVPADPGAVRIGSGDAPRHRPVASDGGGRVCACPRPRRAYTDPSQFVPHQLVATEARPRSSPTGTPFP